jgi:hypothetical protein
MSSLEGALLMWVAGVHADDDEDAELLELELGWRVALDLTTQESQP